MPFEAKCEQAVISPDAMNPMIITFATKTPRLIRVPNVPNVPFVRYFLDETPVASVLRLPHGRIVPIVF